MGTVRTCHLKNPGFEPCLVGHGSNAGHSSGVPGVDARRATPPDPRGWRTGGSLAVSSPTPATPLLSPAKIRELNHAACRAARFPRVNEHTPAHRRSAWATRGLASHTELPKSLRTIPTYIVYDNVTQCFGHKLLSGAMRFSEKTNDPLHWLRTEGPGTFRLQGNVSGHCRLIGAQSLTCLEYFARRLIRSVRPDRVRLAQSIDDGVSSGGFSQT